MNDRESGECLELELESAETLQDVIAVCERASDRECELDEREKVLTDELRRLQMNKHKLKTVKTKAEAKRAVIKALEDLFCKGPVDKGNFLLLMDHIQERESLQLAVRYVGRHQLNLCQTLQRLLFDKEKTETMLRLSPAVKRKSAVLVSKLMNKFTQTVAEMKSTMDMKCQLHTRLESLDLCSRSGTQASPRLTSQQRKDGEKEAHDIWMPGGISSLDQQLHEIAGEIANNWRDLSVHLGVSSDIVTSIQRDITTKREQAWLMLKHYALTVESENVRRNVRRCLLVLGSQRRAPEARTSVFSSTFHVDSDCHFYGRDKELDNIQCCFWGSKSTQTQSCQVQSFVLQVIHGASGVGKTYLAIQYALKFCDVYCDGVFYFNAESWPSLHVSLRQLTGVLDLPPDGGLFEDNRCFLNYIMLHSQVLIVYDGVRDLDLLQRAIPSQTTKVHILVTTEASNPHPIIDTARCVTKLEPLSIEHAVPALLSWASYLSSSPSEEEAICIKELVSQVPVCSMPLSIVHAGKYAQQSHVTPIQLNKILQVRVKEFKLVLSDMDCLLDSFHLGHLKEKIKRHVSSPSQLQVAEFEDINSLDIDSHDKLVMYVVKHRLSDSSLSYLVYQLAIDHLAKSAPDAVQLLEYACLMGSDNVPGNIMAEIVFGDSENKALHFSNAVVALLLSSLSRVSELNGEYYFSFHPVIQSALIERLILSGRASHQTKIVKLSQCLIKFLPFASSRILESFSTNQLSGLVIHLYCLAGHVLSSNCSDVACQKVVTAACRTALAMGHSSISYDLCSRLLAVVESSCEKMKRKDPRLWTALVLLGRSCQLYEDLSGAQTHYERALQWMEGIGEEVIEELGGPAKSVLSDEYSFVVDELARCYGAQQIFADPQGEDLVSSRGEQDDVTATANALHGMGYKYHLRGQLRESIEAYEQCLALRGSIHSSGDLNVAQTMINLAVSLIEAGENVRAKTVLEDAITALRRFLPAHHPRIATAVKYYARCCLDSGDTEKAQKLSEERLNVLMSSLPADHPRLAIALVEHAEMNRKTGGSLDVSISLCKQGVEIMKLQLPAQRDLLATGLHNLGYYYYAKDMYAEAITLLEESVKLKSSLRLSQPEFNYSLSLALLWLGNAHVKCNHVEMATVKFKECLHYLKGSQSHDTEMTLSVLISLGNLTSSMDRLEEAVKYHSEARELLLHTSPHSEFAVVVSMLLANCYYRLGQLDKSEEGYTEALTIARQFYPDHPFTREAEQNLHSVWQLKYGN